MPVVRSRRTTTSKSPVSRRRDRAAEVEETEEDEDVDATQRPAPRKKTAAAKVAAAKKKPRPAPEPEEDEEDEELEDEDLEEGEDEEEEDADDEDDADAEDEEDEEEEPPPPRRKKAAATKKVARKPKPVEEDEEEEDEAPRRRTKKKTTELPPGVYKGNDGIQKMRDAGGGGADRLKITNEPVLIKILENEALASFRQHWISAGGPGQGNRPYTCPGKGCPLCALGDRTAGVSLYNVLVLSEGEPSNKIMNLGVKASEALQAVAGKTKSGKSLMDRGYFAVTKSGKNNSVQTNFRPLKEEDLFEDWPEIFEEDIDPDELDAVVAEAMENLFDISVVEVKSMKQLRETAKYLTDDDAED